MTTKGTIQKFIDSILSNGGASFNINTGELNPKQGYFASIQGYELKLTGYIGIGVYGKQIAFIDSFNKKIKSYIKNNAEILNSPNHFLGGWTNDSNNVVLDVSIQFDTLKEAAKFGILNNQDAIYDAKNDKVINLPSAQRCGTLTQRVSYARIKAYEISEQNK